MKDKAGDFGVISYNFLACDFTSETM